MLEHLDDLASDLSAVHGVRDVMALPAPVFFKLAFRLPSYQGVMRDYLVAEANGHGPAAEEPDRAAPAPRGPAGEPVKMVGGSRAELQAEPAFAGILSFG